MNGWLRGRTVLALTIAGALSLSVGSTPVGAARAQAFAIPEQRATASLDTAGLRVVPGIVQSHPGSEAQAQALSLGLELAEEHPDDVGYPWIDPRTGTLELSAASTHGVGLLTAARSLVGRGTLVREVKFSYGKLEAIKHSLTTLHAAGVPDAELIYETAPDHEGNRIVVVVSRPSPRLFHELAARYGTEAIEVMIDPHGPGGGTASRLFDTSPFWGGARIYTNTLAYYCTDSFPWATNFVNGDAMLTAAHCASTGGTVRIGDSSSPTVASVSATVEENWSATTGTTYYQGDSVYRGDVALMRITSPKISGTYIYRGPRDSSTSSPVLSRLGRYSVYGDQVYVGGQTTGETGPWTVAQVGIDWWYSNDGPNVWIRNANNAPHNPPGGTCVDHGDSGGSVFTVVSGGVKAVGTLSGFGPNNCTMIFTDIYRTYLWLPGDVHLH